MATEITLYTDTDAVRGALLLDADEVPDEMLVNQGLEVALLADLDEWVPTHDDIWAAALAPAAEATDLQSQRYLQLYSMWFCALRLAEAHVSWPQQMTDGKMEIRRFQQVDFEALMVRCRGHVERYKRALLVALGTAQAAVTRLPRLIGGVRADYDPVVGGTDTR